MSNRRSRLGAVHAWCAMVAAALALVSAAPRAVGGAAEDEPEEPRVVPKTHTKYIVYQRTDYKGNVSLGVMAVDEFRTELEEVVRTNKVLRHAYSEARKAWKEDTKRKKVQFPMPAPQLLRLERLATYSDEDRAKSAEEKRQERLDKKSDRIKEREDRRLARMNDVARKRESEHARLVEEARKLFEEKVEELLEGPEDKGQDKDEDDDQGKEKKGE